MRSRSSHTASTHIASTHIVLVGQMGVGKSTLGDALAEQLERVHADCDDDLVAVIGVSAADYAASHGVPALHELEAGVLLDRLADDDGLVISAAASVIDSSACRDALRERALVVWIDDAPLEVSARSGDASHRRPMSTTEVLALDARRRPLYEKLADVRVTPSMSVDDGVAAVVAVLDG